MSKTYKVDNAIIFAAGRGSRLNELTKKTPKPLLIGQNNLPLIEDIIKKLVKKNIHEIFIVVGYKWRKFKYLEKKYNLKLIRNRDWHKFNNVGSLSVALKNMANSLIINGDIILYKNILQNEYSSAITYGEKNNNIDEWIIKTNKNGNIIDFIKNGKSKSGIYQREITFITKEIVENINNDILDFDPQEYYEYLVLNVTKKYKIDFKVFPVSKNIITDIDNINDFHLFINKSTI